MSLISVDFVSLDLQVEQLRKCLDFMNDMQDRTSDIYRSLKDMELGEIENEMAASLRYFTESADQIAAAVRKLEQIIDLYNECENSIFTAAGNLPYNMPSRNTGASGNNFENTALPINISSGIFSELKTSYFSGHQIMNEEWLDNLIY